MKKYSAFIIIILIYNLNCKKSSKELLNHEISLSRNASVNLEIKNLKESLEDSETDFERAKVHTKIAAIESEKGDTSSSIKSSRTAIKYQPNQYMSHYLLGKSYIEAGRYYEAIGELMISLDMNNQFANSYFELGNAYYKLQNYGNAISMYHKAISIDDKFYDAYNNLAVLYSAFGRVMEAEKFFLKVLEIKPAFAKVYKNLGILYDLKLNNKQKAVEYYKKYLSLKPNCAERKLIKSWISMLEG